MPRRTGLHLALGLAVWAAATACSSLPAAAMGMTPIPNLAATGLTRPPTPQLFPSLTPPPLANRTPDPTATPAPSLRQLASGGCCVQPFWSPDGSQIRFIDKPSDTAPSGIWAVPAEGGPAEFVTDKVGVYSPDGALRAYVAAGQTKLERLASGETWAVPAGGRAVVFSPSGAQIAWQAASSTTHFDRRQVEVWSSNADGSSPRRAASLIGGALWGWFPDGRLLITGSLKVDEAPAIMAVDPASGDLETLAPADHVDGLALSPAGGWLAFQVLFSGDPNQDGLWVQPLNGGRPQRLPWFGAYTWSREGRLFVIPMESAAGGQRLMEWNAAAGQARALTDPGVTPVRILADNWSLAPDGRRLAFVNAADQNLWLLTLP